MIRIAETRVEYQKAPMGIDQNPRFSWKLWSDRRGTLQEEFWLQIAKEEGFSEIVWEEHRRSRQSAHVMVQGLPLRSMQKYFYRVRVRDCHGEESPYSKTGFFYTAYLKPKDWRARMITAETEADAENSKSTCLRKEFTVKGPVAHACVCATALGLYQLYVDGARVGEDELTPGWTSYHKHLRYQLYDVTGLLQEPGRHCIGGLVGAGWYKGLMGFLGLRNNYGSRTGFLCQLHIVYQDGSQQILGTDGSWTAQDGPVTFAEIYDGEIYDANMEHPGWSCPGAGGCWRPVEELPFEYAILRAQPGCRPGQIDHMPAKRVLRTPEGDTVIDFGQNMAGWIQVRLHGARKGERLELVCFEELDAAGNVYTENLRSARQRMVYLCDGRAEAFYEPHFTYMGFRYAKVVSWPGQWELGDVSACSIHSRMEQTGFFSCSNQDLNQLYHNILWGMKSNFLDVPTDCPQRNERMGWTGDAQIFGRTAAYLMDVYPFFEKWLIDLAADQTEEGGVPHMVPDIITPNIHKKEDWLLSQGTHSAAAWADAAVLNPWYLYLTYGDRQILRDQYDSMKAWIDFMRAHAKQGIWNYRLQFGDWVALDAEEGSYFGATPNDLTCTAYYAWSTGIFARIAGILGHTEEAEEYRQAAEEIKNTFVTHFFDSETKGMRVQTQTAHILALYFGLTPEEYRQQTVAELLKLWQEAEGHLRTGFVGTPYFTHVLSQNGHLAEAYELLLKEDFPSWLYQVRQGATTVWEHWDGKKPDGTMWSADMNSFNHYAYGAVGEWLYRVIAGIEWEEEAPGYEQIHFYPQPGGGLTWAEGSYESVYGRVSCRWERLEKEGLKVSCHVPANCRADLRLDHVSAIRWADAPARLSEGVCMAEMGSGDYVFVVA